MTLEQIKAIWAANSNQWNSEWSISGSRYQTYNLFREILKDDALISALWCGSMGDWRNKNVQSEANPYGTRAPVMENEHTYNDCTEWKYDIPKNRLTITVYDGEILSGNPKGKRAEWVYEIRDDHTQIVAIIESKLREYVLERAACQHADWVEEQTKRRIKKRYEIMMGAAA